jgi:hypothetical protein
MPASCTPAKLAAQPVATQPVHRPPCAVGPHWQLAGTSTTLVQVVPTKVPKLVMATSASSGSSRPGSIQQRHSNMCRHSVTALVPAAEQRQHCAECHTTTSPLDGWQACSSSCCLLTLAYLVQCCRRLPATEHTTPPLGPPVTERKSGSAQPPVSMPRPTHGRTACQAGAAKVQPVVGPSLVKLCCCAHTWHLALTPTRVVPAVPSAT